MTDIETLEDILHRERLAEMGKEVYEGDTAPEWHDRVDKIIDEYIPANDFRGNITEWAERRVRPQLEIERLEFAEDILNWQLKTLIIGCMYPVALLIFLIFIMNL